MSKLFKQEFNISQQRSSYIYTTGIKVANDKMSIALQVQMKNYMVAKDKACNT